MISSQVGKSCIELHVSETLANNITEIEAKCVTLGIETNFENVLISALEKELKGLERKVQHIDRAWRAGQMFLPGI